MSKQVTYDSILKDDEFLNDAYKALTGMGIMLVKEEGDIVIKFYKQKIF